MSTRRAARQRALGLVYEMDLRGRSSAQVLTDVLDGMDVLRRDRLESGEDLEVLLLEEPPVLDPYAIEVVLGVSQHERELDGLLDTYSEHWTVARMPVVDRALLRIATYELRYGDLPAGVVINEAVELAKEYSTQDSPRFVNGLLARIAEEVRPRVGAAAPEVEQ